MILFDRKDFAVEAPTRNFSRENPLNPFPYEDRASGPDNLPLRRHHGAPLARFLLFGLLAASLFNAPVAGQVTAMLSSPDIATAARDVAKGGRLHVDGVMLGDESASLELRRFEVLSRSARVVAHGPDGETDL